MPAMKFTLWTPFALLAILIPCLAQESVPYKDTRLSFERRVDDLLSHMTLEEKVSQMMNDSPAMK